MVDAARRLRSIRVLVEEALFQVDEADETYLGILLDTALHEIDEKIRRAEGADR